MPTWARDSGKVLIIESRRRLQFSTQGGAGAVGAAAGGGGVSSAAAGVPEAPEAAITTC